MPALEKSARIEKIPVSLNDLTNISLEAAIELDKLLQGESINEAVLVKLSENLSSTYSSSKGENNALFLNYPSAFEVLNRTLHSTEHKELNTVADLTDGVADYINMLSTVASERTHAMIQKSLAFCVSLHRELVFENSHINANPRFEN